MNSLVTFLVKSNSQVPYIARIDAAEEIIIEVLSALAPYFTGEDIPCILGSQVNFSISHNVGNVKIEEGDLHILSNMRGNEIWFTARNSYLYDIDGEIIEYKFTQFGVDIITSDSNKIAISAIKRAVYIHFIQHCRRIGFLHIHASAITLKDSGFIFLGEKGTGKTTAMLFGLLEGWDFVSNDQVLIGNIGDECVAIGLPISVHVCAGASSIFHGKNFLGIDGFHSVSSISKRFKCHIIPEVKLKGCVILRRSNNCVTRLERLDNLRAKASITAAHTFKLPSNHQPFWVTPYAKEKTSLADINFYFAQYAGVEINSILCKLEKILGQT